MIIEYHRPTTLEEALALLQRAEPVTLPLGGGTVLTQASPQPVAAVDLQALGLDKIQPRGNFAELGAALTLQGLIVAAGPESDAPLPLPPALIAATRHQAAYNERQVATLAGTIVSGTGRSPLLTTLLALDASLTMLPESGGPVSLGDFLPLRDEKRRGRLITAITIPLNVRLGYDYVARTPADQPVVSAAVAVWPSGRRRVALGGYGPAPALAFDGPDSAGAVEAAQSAYAQAGDEWASAAYRQEMAGVLVKRILETV